ncbi:lactaldehyde reductase [Escherichia coli]|nr:lactaldehyde reductase [Escherichia coli]
MVKRLMLNETSYHGAGSIKKIVPEIKKRKFKKVFICTDSILVEVGVAAKVTTLLEKASISFDVFSKIKANPTIENVLDGVEAFKQSNADVIVTIGGGSAIDTAKAIGIIIKNPDFGDVKSLEGFDVSPNKSVPIIAVPTTAGTAAEVTINYVITDTENQRKMVMVDTHDIPVVAVIDPDMMASMPAMLKAGTGMDALTHAIEGYINKDSWLMSDMFTLRAIELISSSLRDAVAGKPEGDAGMAYGEYIAGMGFSNCGVGNVHAMSHPLGAIYDTPHGIANAIILPTVMEFNAEAAGEKYRDIARAMGVKGTDSMTPEQYRKAAIDAVKQLSSDVGIPTTLKGIARIEDIDLLAECAYNDGNRLSNPRETSVADMKQLYLALL